MRATSILIIISTAIIFLGCKNGQQLDGAKKASIPISKKINTKDRPSEENVGLPGYRFECVDSRISTSIGTLECGIQDESNNFLDFSGDVNKLTAEIKSDANESFNRLESLDPFKPIKYEVDSSAFGLSLTELYETSMISVTATIDGKTGSTEQQIRSTFSEKEVASFSFYRIYIDSIENSAFVNPSACLSFVEFREGGIWLDQVQKDPLQANIGAYDVHIDVSSLFNDPINVVGVLGENGLHWESEGVFQELDPFDALVETWMEFEFITSAPKIEAIRFNSHVELYPLLGECYPDKLRVSGSNDGINFTEIHSQSILNPSNFPNILLKWN